LCLKKGKKRNGLPGPVFFARKEECRPLNLHNRGNSKILRKGGSLNDFPPPAVNLYLGLNIIIRCSGPREKKWQQGFGSSGKYGQCKGGLGGGTERPLLLLGWKNQTCCFQGILTQPARKGRMGVQSSQLSRTQEIKKWGKVLARGSFRTQDDPHQARAVGRMEPTNRIGGGGGLFGEQPKQL